VLPAGANPEAEHESMPHTLARWQPPGDAEIRVPAAVGVRPSAMLDFAQFGIDLDDHVITVDVRRQRPILVARILLSHG
jgi:hypothetical protein